MKKFDHLNNIKTISPNTLEACAIDDSIPLIDYMNSQYQDQYGGSMPLLDVLKTNEETIKGRTHSVKLKNPKCQITGIISSKDGKFYLTSLDENPLVSFKKPSYKEDEEIGGARKKKKEKKQKTSKRLYNLMENLNVDG